MAEYERIEGLAQEKERKRLAKQARAAAKVILYLNMMILYHK